MFVRENDFGSRPLAPVILLGLGAVAILGGSVLVIRKGYKMATKEKKETKEVHPPKDVKQKQVGGATAPGWADPEARYDRMMRSS